MAAQAADPAPVASRGGMVVTAQRLASEVGAQVLRQGGNAVDAAVAVGYALAVTYPEAGNLGGGGFMTLRLADGRTTFIDFREKAPLAASANMFLDAQGGVVPGMSTSSWASVATPGSPAGLEYARVHYGTWPRERLMAPAIKLAQGGFTLGQGDAGIFEVATPRLAQDRASATIFLPHGAPMQEGDRLVQPDLARALAAISALGPDAAFYHGPIGHAIAQADHAGGGLLTDADFAQYHVREMAPVTCAYRGYTVVSAPPPSSGGVTLCEILQILQGYDLAGMGFHSAAEVHVLAEAMRHAYIDRNNRLGDPDFIQNPVAELICRAACIRGCRERGPPDHPIFRGRSRGQCGLRHLHAEQLVRRGAHGAGHRHRAQRRDGRFRQQAWFAQHVRACAGQGGRDRAGQDAAELDGADDRDQGRPSGDGGGLAGWQPDHHHRARGDHQRYRPWHDGAGSDRRAAHPHAGHAGCGAARTRRAFAGHAQDS
jgi:hypothetical protein